MTVCTYYEGMLWGHSSVFILIERQNINQKLRKNTLHKSYSLHGTEWNYFLILKQNVTHYLVEKP